MQEVTVRGGLVRKQQTPLELIIHRRDGAYADYVCEIEQLPHDKKHDANIDADIDAKQH